MAAICAQSPRRVRMDRRRTRRPSCPGVAGGVLLSAGAALQAGQELHARRGPFQQRHQLAHQLATGRVPLPGRPRAWLFSVLWAGSLRRCCRKHLLLTPLTRPAPECRNAFIAVHKSTSIYHVSSIIFSAADLRYPTSYGTVQFFYRNTALSRFRVPHGVPAVSCDSRTVSQFPHTLRYAQPMAGWHAPLYSRAFTVIAVK